MLNKSKWVSAAVALTALSTLSLAAAPAEAAIVYCKTAGAADLVPKRIFAARPPRNIRTG
jgi:hypothetical protein